MRNVDRTQRSRGALAGAGINGMRNMLLMILLLLAAASTQAWAEDAGQERDPFFSEGPRTAVTASVPADNNWGSRDPFSRPFEGAVPLSRTPVVRVPGKTLTGILYSKDTRLAIIGGETFREGNMVGDRKLVDIRKRSVVLRNDAGNTEEMFLDDFSIRK